MEEYATLVASMRTVPSFEAAESVIKTDYTLKLPSRVYLHLWNTPEISQFRGYQDDLDEADRKEAGDD